MSRNNHNAIILTSIQGEAGLQGFPGYDGWPVQCGTGDPNTLTTLTYPDYSNDPGAGSGRGTDELVYQDTDTGDVWTYTYVNGAPTTGTWVIVDNNSGAPGNQGAPAIDKIDIVFADESRANRPYKRSRVRYQNHGPQTQGFELAKFTFPGTNLAPDLITPNKITLLGYESGDVIKYEIINEDGNVVADADRAGIYRATLLNFIQRGAFPADPEQLRLVAYFTPRWKFGNWRYRYRYIYTHSFSIY
jgi:hypothetical protein